MTFCSMKYDILYLVCQLYLDILRHTTICVICMLTLLSCSGFNIRNSFRDFHDDDVIRRLIVIFNVFLMLIDIRRKNVMHVKKNLNCFIPDSRDDRRFLILAKTCFNFCFDTTYIKASVLFLSSLSGDSGLSNNSKLGCTLSGHRLCTSTLRILCTLPEAPKHKCFD